MLYSMESNFFGEARGVDSVLSPRGFVENEKCNAQVLARENDKSNIVLVLSFLRLNLIWDSQNRPSSLRPTV